MAEKSTRLLLDALCRAAAEPAGLALLTGKSEPGLFPLSARAKSVAERCKSEGYLQVIRTEPRGKTTREICVLTEKGRDYLLLQSHPRQVLEDFVRLLETRRGEVTTLLETVRGMLAGLQSIQSAVETILPRLQESHSNGTAINGVPSMNGTATHHAPVATLTTFDADALIAEMKAKLAEWHASAGASQDCPLPELFRKLEVAEPVSLGRFHDCLRQLNEENLISLNPWTGPLYAMPEPTFALLVGHGIMYYAGLR